MRFDRCCLIPCFVRAGVGNIVLARLHSPPFISSLSEIQFHRIIPTCGACGSLPPLFFSPFSFRPYPPLPQDYNPEPAKFRHTLRHANGFSNVPMTAEEKQKHISTVRGHRLEATNGRHTGGKSSGTAAKRSSGFRVGSRRTDLPGAVPSYDSDSDKKEPSYTHLLASQARENKLNSGWSVMVKFADVVSDMQDQEMRRQRAENQAAQRHYLDNQMAALARKEAEERRAQQEEYENLRREVEEYKQAEADMAQARMEAARMRQEDAQREQQEMENRKAREAARMRREEQQELENLRQLEEADRAERNRVLEEKKAAYAKTRRENEAALARKRDLANKAAEEERRRMKEQLEYLERVDRERREALENFYASIAARAATVGEISSGEAKAREEKEAAMLAKYKKEADAAAEAKAKAKADLERRVNDDLRNARETQLALKDARKQAQRNADAEFATYVRTMDKRNLEADKRAIEEKRANAVANRHELERQIREREEREILEEAVMTANEARLNEQILQEAERVMDLNIQGTLITPRHDLKFASTGKYM